MVTIHFHCRTTGAEVACPPVSTLVIRGDQLELHGEGLQIEHHNGWWNCGGQRFLFGTVDGPTTLCFENENEGSPHYGPFTSIHLIGGCLWVTPNGATGDVEMPRRRCLFAQFCDAAQRWLDFEKRDWSAIRVQSSKTTTESTTRTRGVNHV